MEYQKMPTSDNIPRFVTKKNGLKFMISQAVLKIDINQVNNKDLKHQC